VLRKRPRHRLWRKSIRLRGQAGQGRLQGTSGRLDRFRDCRKEPIMTQELSSLYQGYIDCLNRQAWERLEDFVAAGVVYNGREIGLEGYREMLVGDFRAIPDLHFTIDFLVVEAPKVASRLVFDCTPTGELFGLPVNGQRIRFSENVFYQFSEERIDEVWSIIDKAAIEAQLP
jgi:predicted ester cyclase